MSVEVLCEYTENLTVINTHGPSSSRLDTTAPVDNGGTGDLFSPTDLVATSLGACMLTIMGKVAENNNVDLKGAKVRVIKEMNDNPRRIGKLTTTFEFANKYSPAIMKKLEVAAHSCPVKRSLHPDIELDVTFNWL